MVWSGRVESTAYSTLNILLGVIEARSVKCSHFPPLGDAHKALDAFRLSLCSGLDAFRFFF